MNLYEITENYKNLMLMMEDPDIDPQAIEDTAESIKDTLHDKADAYAKIIRMWKGQISAIKEEKARLSLKQKTLENGIDRLLENLEFAMRETGETKFKTNLFGFNIQKLGARPLELDVLPINLPEEVVEYEIKVDKKLLGDLLKEDPEEYGQYCHFGEQKEGLVIR